MKKKQYILAGTMLVSLSLGAQAQTQPQDTTMNRTVVVEQEYNPDIMDASKVNVLPRVEPPTVSKKAVEYDATLMPATHIPAGIMQAYTGKRRRRKRCPDMYAWDTVTTVTSMYAPTTSSLYPPKTAST